MLDVTESFDFRCTTRCTSDAETPLAADPELAAVVAAWPTLPVPIRVAVLALVNAAATGAAAKGVGSLE